MKALLINPPFQRPMEIRNSYFPLGLGYLAAALDKDGFHVMIYNADKGKEENNFIELDNLNRVKVHQKYLNFLLDDSHYVWKEIKDIVREEKPDVVGISMMTSTSSSAIKTASIVKQINSRCWVIMGGPHPTVRPEETLQNDVIDFVIRGEGEETIVELVRALSAETDNIDKIEGLSYKRDGRVVNNPGRKLISNLDKIPFPARKLLLFSHLYSPAEMGVLMSGRGCPFQCTFCGSKTIWERKARFRSLDNLFEEIQTIQRDYNPPYLVFWDDTFLLDRKRAISLCQRLIEKNIQFEKGWMCEARVNELDEELLKWMKRSGCQSVFIGIESGSDRVLKEIKKGITVADALQKTQLLRKLNINFVALFMVGFPQESEEEIRKTMRLMRRIKPTRINICVFTPYPGSELFEILREDGIIPENPNWNNYSQHSLNCHFSRHIPYDVLQDLVLELVELGDRLNDWHRVPIKVFWRKRHSYLRRPRLFIKTLTKYFFRKNSS